MKTNGLIKRMCKEESREKLKKFITLFGVMWLFGMFLLQYNLFLTAYHNPDKKVCITIDDYNEADIEHFIVMPSLFIFGLLSIVFVRQEVSKC